MILSFRGPRYDATIGGSMTTARWRSRCAERAFAGWRSARDAPVRGGSAPRHPVFRALLLGILVCSRCFTGWTLAQISFPLSYLFGQAGYVVEKHEEHALH